MARLLRMPEVAANAVEAVLQEWQVAENAPFSAEDTIATVETEKAVVDVEAEADGVILKALVPNGAQVEVGAPIALVGESGEKVDDLDALMTQLGVAVSGSATAPERREVPESEPAARDTNGAVNGKTAERIFASPLARRMAREAGLAVEEISGSGPRGRIIRRDVEAAISARADGEPTASPEPTVADRTRPGHRGEAEAFTEMPHTRIRKAIATRLVESKQTAPHFYLRATIRVDDLLRMREQLNTGGQVKVSVNDLVVKAVARAHTLVPAMNVTWAPDVVRSFSTVDVGVAVATDRGLITPVLREVDRMSISEVAARTRELAERAKAGQLRQEELEGGTVSVTNLGMFGTEEFAAIINPPQAAILAVGAARQEPVVVDGALAVGTVMRVTLSVDHRPVDGVIAAEWMRAFVSLVENPVQILA